MTQLVSREAHRFEAAGRSYLYLVPSAAVFGLDETSRAVIDALDDSPWQADDLVDALGPELGRTEVRAAVDELAGARAIGRVETQPEATPPAPNITALLPARLALAEIDSTKPRPSVFPPMNLSPLRTMVFTASMISADLPSESMCSMTATLWGIEQLNPAHPMARAPLTASPRFSGETSQLRYRQSRP